MTAVLEARPVGGALADDTRSGSVRLVRVEAFEPAVYVAPEHRDAYERRFVTLLVDEAHHAVERVRESLSGALDSRELVRLRALSGREFGRKTAYYRAMTTLIRALRALGEGEERFERTLEALPGEADGRTKE